MFPQFAIDHTVGRLLIAEEALVYSISYVDFGDGSAREPFLAIAASFMTDGSIPIVDSEVKSEIAAIIAGYRGPDESGSVQQSDVVASAVGFKLPWPNGAAYSISQGWGGSYSHPCPGQQCYAYDFSTPEGTEIRASASGRADDVVGSYGVNHCGGYDYRNAANRVVVNHDDGTATLYLHLRAVSVGNGNTVVQGQKIGESGKTGWTNCNAHLHFQRQAQGAWITNSTPIYFDEYPGQQLAAGGRYTSGNGGGGGNSCTGGTPSLSSPGNGHVVTAGQSQSFSWSSVANCTRYRFEAWNTTGSGSHHVDVTGTSLSFTPSNAGEWKWQVAVIKSDGGYGAFPHTNSFTVRPQVTAPGKPHTPNPANGATLTYRTDLDISFQADGTEFQIHVWGTNYDRWIDWQGNRGVHLSGLAPGTYTWQANARNSAGASDWGPEWRFTIGDVSCPNQYRAEYFNNRSLSGSPALIRCEGWPIAHDWGNGSPAQGVVNTDSFSARWQSRVTIDAGAYTFAARGDDGIRVWVDGTLIIDRWDNNQPEYTVSRTFSSTAQHDIKVEYNDNGGAAVVQFRWFRDCSVVPSEQYCAEYFNNKDLSGSPAVANLEAKPLNQPWGMSGPGSGINADAFSGRWRGKFAFSAGTYTFQLRGDDGVRLKIDGVTKINEWRHQNATTFTATVAMTAGVHEIAVEYYEDGGWAELSLQWGVVVDSSPPVARWSSPANNAVVTTRTLLLQATVTDAGGSGIDRVAFSAKWSGSWHTVAEVRSASGPWSYTWDLCAAGVPDGATDIELGLQAYDNAENEFVYSQSYVNYHVTKQYTCNPNTSPTANAGPDQIVTDTDRNGSQAVTLNGSGSRDSDGSIASYIWLEGATQIATGVTPTVTLNAGSHTVTLRVTDDDGATATDTVVIVVNRPPVADAGTDRTVTDADGNGTQSVSLSASGSNDPDGTIASYVWLNGSTQIATGATPSVLLAVGTHTLTLRVTDNRGATATDTVTVEVARRAVQACSSVPSGSYCVDYYAGHDLAGSPLVATSDVAPLSHVWQGSAPMSGVPADHYSARWQGRFVFPESGVYDFFGQTDDGIRVLIDDVEVHRDWEAHSAPVSFSRHVAAGEHTVTIEYFENDGWASIKLDWRLANRAPVADAGPDQSLTDGDGNGSQAVALDGTASSDPDQGALSYSWKNGSTTIGSGASPSVTLSVGTHTITLTVTDPQGLSASDTVVVTVNPGETPSTPVLTLDKEKSKYNGWVTARLSGFAPNSSVTLSWPRRYEITSGPDDGQFTTILATGITDAGGRLTLRFRTPLEPVGDYTVTAKGAGNRDDTAILRVSPRIMLNETEGPAETRLRVYFYGFGPNEEIEVRWHTNNSTSSSYDVVQRITVADNGRASALVPIPRGESAGDHRIVGKVIGVSRSASTTFTLTRVAAAEMVDATPTPGRGMPTATPTAGPTQEVTVTPSPTVEPTSMPEPTATPTAEPTIEPTPTPTPTPLSPEPTPTAVLPEETDTET
ncbi:MAG: peptidoglycan DD-metalloendopeptidase family protein [Thermomicrobiales bacterium]|nr:peptidoglycan DD-metalloendopeptidase family protein [Thermomicrobiales bacterium]